jgi:menaquinone-dependent protoporphyrinogen oxidase
MRVLIVYASRHGQTRRVAERLADVLVTNGAEVHAFEIHAIPKNLAPHTADVVVLAAPVYFDRHPKIVERFATEHRTDLAKVRSIFVSVSGAARSVAGMAQADTYARAFFGRAGWMPDHVELVAGGEPYTQYNWLTRWFMVRHNRKFGRTVDSKRDYDFTDWDQVDQLGKDMVGDTLQAARIAQASVQTSG